MKHSNKSFFLIMHVYVVGILMLIKQAKNIRIAAKACTKAALVSL